MGRALDQGLEAGVGGGGTVDINGEWSVSSDACRLVAQCLLKGGRLLRIGGGGGGRVGPEVSLKQGSLS